jgi:NIPSNAP
MSLHLQARIQLKYGMSAQFHENMAKLVPIVERTGWKLVGSWQQITGDIHEVLDLWEVPDANAVPATLGALALDEDVTEIMKGISEAAIREELILCVKTPFSP